jgi:hypothetical protein
MNRQLEEELTNEIEAGSFNKKIKTHCAWCNAYIYKSLDRYIEMGNACKECSLRFSHVLDGIRGKSRGRNNIGRMVTRTFKIREYTEEEVNEMIAHRLKEVKLLKLYAKP